MPGSLKIQLNPIAHATLIKSHEPLPSQLLKNTAALNSGLVAEARVERCVQPQPIVIAARAKRAVTRLIPDPWILIPDPGGAGRDRTDDLLLAKQALSQLSYSPGSCW